MYSNAAAGDGCGDFSGRMFGLVQRLLYFLDVCIVYTMGHSAQPGIVKNGRVRPLFYNFSIENCKNHVVSGQNLQYIFFHVNVTLSRKHLYSFLDAFKIFQRLVSPKLW